MTRVLYVGNGFCKAKGMTGDLPKYLMEAGVDVDVLVPHLKGIDEGAGRLAERLVPLQAYVDGAERRMVMFEGRNDSRVRIFYIDEPTIQPLKHLSLDSDEGIRACAVFAHAVVQWMMRSPVSYDIVHCEGLETALIPTLMRTSYKNEARLASVRTIATIAGIEDKGNVDMSWLSRLGLPNELSSSEGMEFYGKLSILKGVYLFADAIQLPNDGLSRRIEKNRGKDIGMEGVLFDRVDRLHTFSMGIDAKSYNPENDKFIATNFNANDLSGKAKCKAALIQQLHLKKDRPVVVFMGGFDSDSGIDLVNDILDDLMDRNVNLIVCGHGSQKYTESIMGWKDEFKGNIAVMGCPGDDMFRKILSGADIFLYPAQRETLSRKHLYAMRYGAVCVARYHGSIVNDIRRVRDLDKIGAEDNGFTFVRYDSDEFFDAVMDALDVFETPDFAELRKHAAEKITCLCQTAKECAQLYDSLMGK